MISCDQLKSLLNYNPETGHFHWLESSNSRRKNLLAGAKRPDGYIQISVSGKLYMAHRLAWLYVHGLFPDFDIDHVNMVRDDNRLLNLRIATRRQNLANTLARIGYKGVTYSKSNKGWMARIQRSGKVFYLGTFSTAEEAASAYKAAAMEFDGEFYRV